MRRTVISLAIALAACSAAAVAAQSQEPAAPVSVWDGVYTKEQAGRGRQAYDANCSSCHRADLGGANGRALVGTRFWQDWGEDTLQSLSGIARQTMPRGAAGSLPEASYLDIVAYILERNGYPSGPIELTRESVAGIRVQRKEGPGPVPNYALVITAGCLERSGDVWSLAGSSEPVRTRNPDPSTESAAMSRGDTAGPQTFQLMDVYTSGDGHEGHRMEAKGFLIRGTPDRINVTSLRMIGDRCTP